MGRTKNTTTTTTTTATTDNTTADTATARAPKLSIEQRVELLRLEAKDDAMLASAMPAIDGIVAQLTDQVAQMKRTKRRLRNLVKGLMD